MKKIFILLATIVALASTLTSNAQDLTSISGFINVNKGSYAYSLTSDSKFKIKRDRIFSWGLYSTTNSKYDSYIILYKGVDCYVPESSVVDNSGIVLANSIIENRKVLDSLNLQLSPIVDSINCIKSAQDSIGRKANSLDAKLKDLKFDAGISEKAALRDSMFAIKHNPSIMKAYCDYYGISLIPQLANISYSLSEYNSVGGHDFEFTATNASGKTVKYMDITLSGYKNGVNDYVHGDYGEKKSLRDTGPHEDGYVVGGIWKNVIYNYSATTPVISSVKLIYMDGTSCTIPGSKIKSASQQQPIEDEIIHADASIYPEDIRAMIEQYFDYEEIYCKCDALDGTASSFRNSLVQLHIERYPDIARLENEKQGLLEEISVLEAQRVSLEGSRDVLRAKIQSTERDIKNAFSILKTY